MEEGMRLREMHTGLIAVVESVHPTHMVLRFEDVGLEWIIDQRNYGKFEVLKAVSGDKPEEVI